MNINKTTNIRGKPNIIVKNKFLIEVGFIDEQKALPHLGHLENFAYFECNLS